MIGKIKEDKVILENGKEVFETGWYGKLKKDKVELALIEACLLLERQRIQIKKNKRAISFKKFFRYCCESDPRFAFRYAVYKDLRERGLPTRTGFKGCDFRVYERGAKPGMESKLKWIVFAESEDYPCGFDKLEKAIRLAQNIRAEALWAIVDNDGDVTFYVIRKPSV